MKQLFVDIRYQDGEQVGVYIGMIISVDYHPSIKNAEIVDTAFNEHSFENVISLAVSSSDITTYLYFPE